MTPAPLKLAPHETRILDRLDLLEKESESAGSTFSRRDRRWPWRRGGLVVSIEQPGGSISLIKVSTRNLSCEGISFLVNRFVYVKSSVSVALPRADGKVQNVTGVITHCAHVEGTMHLAGVKYDKRINPQQFIALPAAPKGSATSAAAGVEGMRGRVLYLDDSDMDQKLMVHILRGTGIELIGVKTGEAMLAAVKESTFDLVLADLNLGSGKDSVETIRQARANGFTAPIIVLTADAGGPKLAAARDAGAGQTLTKPCPRETLLQVISTLLHRRAGGGSGKIYSALENQPGMAELIEDYIHNAVRISTAQAAGEFETVREHCLNIKGSAGGYGFALLTRAAEEALSILDATMSVDEAKDAIKRLCSMCNCLGIRQPASPHKAA